MKLTDLTSKELSILSLAISGAIDDANGRIEISKTYLPERMHADVTQKDREAIPVLKEFHVQLLNAKQTVREAEKVNEN